MGVLEKKRKLKPVLTDPHILNPSVIENNSHFFPLKLDYFPPRCRG